jgi:hypothetical protein
MWLTESSGYDLITGHTLAHAFAIPSKVTYLEPLMLYTCPYAFSFASTFTNAFARSCNQTLSVSTSETTAFLKSLE